MKILHVVLCGAYADDLSYQENHISKENKKSGNDVKIISTTDSYINGKLGYSEPCRYVNEYGIEVVRVPYKKIFPHSIMKKIRAYKSVYKEIEVFSPDVILFHGMQAFELLTVVRYVKSNPNVKLYLDCHSDYHNSATNFISLALLHKVFYRFCINQSLKFTEKVLCVTSECRQFAEEVYGVPKEIIELYPLGGEVILDEDRKEIRNQIRSELNLSDSDILLVHSGKMDKLKRTVEISKAFKQVSSKKLHLALIGTMSDDIEAEVKTILSGVHQVHYLGWKSTEELTYYLLAADLYVQPGGQSVTMQKTLCCGTPVAVYPHQAHLSLLGESVFYIRTVEDMVNLFKEISVDQTVLAKKRVESFEIAIEKLDNKILAQRICE